MSLDAKKLITVYLCRSSENHVLGFIYGEKMTV